ncbi:glycosyltransferase [Candidatus Pelagibacter sp.]|uniref:glycosyltransferase n=1 Tax=Candidatus Pelagibacter sp. TaxID=2024849 RepID=UPI003F87B47B
MKILSIIETTNESHGGPPEVLKNQMDVINESNRYVYQLSLSKISLLYFIKCLIFKTYRLKIYDFLKKFDIIHFHEIWSLKIIFFVFFANKLLIKHFFVGHGYLDTWSINDKYLKKKFFIFLFLQSAYNSAYASFFSTYNEYLEAKKNIKIFRPFIIPNGLSLNKYKKRNIKKKSRKRILFFGRIHPKKGLNLLIRTIRKLPKDFFDEFTFEITGPGEKKYINDLKMMIQKYSLEKFVAYNEPIYREKKIPYLEKHDVFILPSFEEGDSIALKEALGSYLPVIISKQCRLDIIEKYNAGIVIETNEKNLYEALLKLRSSDLIYMANQARKLIEDEFDNYKCSNRLLDIYRDIYNGSQNSRDWVN